ncbi:MAG TPA: hypothetical protein VFN83_04130 [Gemmatimonadales bacterium]|jgi:hypothetical protein|nr:hypothetical protein [Gemmatimonadales bacterium]
MFDPLTLLAWLGQNLGRRADEGTHGTSQAESELFALLDEAESDGRDFRERDPRSHGRSEWI